MVATISNDDVASVVAGYSTWIAEFFIFLTWLRTSHDVQTLEFFGNIRIGEHLNAMIGVFNNDDIVADTLL